jgi:hypothetical protein
MPTQFKTVNFDKGRRRTSMPAPCLVAYRLREIDLRLAADGRAYVLEANPNPNLAQNEDFAASAKAAGMEYDALLQRVLTLGKSYKAAWGE